MSAVRAGGSRAGPGRPFPLAGGPLAIVGLGAIVAGALTACGWFGGPATPPADPGAAATQAEAPAEGAAAEPGTEGGAPAEPPAPTGPFANGILNEAAKLAPPGSVSHYLATIAGQLQWESDVSQDFALREAISEGEFDARVEARLLGLFFRKGFSILPSPGEGHEFSRDSVVRGATANRRYFARSRDPVRIIFLDQADNVIIIYAKNAGQPQVFNRIPASTVALRESRLDQYLN